MSHWESSLGTGKPGVIIHAVNWWMGHFDEEV